MPELLFVQFRTRFFIPKSREKAALAALRTANLDASEAVRSARTLTEALAAIRWLVHRDDDGNIDGIVGDDEHFNGMEEEELSVLAPFVRRGSSIVIARVRGDNPPPVLFSFDGKKLAVRPLTRRELADEEMMVQPDFEPEEPVAKRPVTGSQETVNAPAKLVPYAPASKFRRGDWIEHPKFGPGVVIDSLDGQRIRVKFAAEERVLVHAQR